MTAGKDGVLVAWNIGFSEQRKLIHAVVKTVDLPREQTGGGYPVSLYYLAPFGPADSIAVGLSSNSILEVKVNSSELCLLITAHSGVLEAVAEHPFKPFYVTAGREKMVRGEFIYLEILVVNQYQCEFVVIFLFTFFFFFQFSLFYFQKSGMHLHVDYYVVHVYMHPLHVQHGHRMVLPLSLVQYKVILLYSALVKMVVQEMVYNLLW